MADGHAYFNIHTSMFTGGEIRGFLAPVPIPAAAWLFGSGLLGLIGVAQRKKTA
ncbi:VPLPA-CTERM sorting domain-containing protein [Sulfuricaulis sp.]|uniref:CHRD domain-containing protein n=1 Tax=Sulfuricaulis sp. TaxID=2003553 RepID=UPI003C762C96